MKVFEAKHKNIYQRIINLKNAIYIELFIVICPLFLFLNFEKKVTLLLITLFIIFIILIIIFRSTTDIEIITFTENEIILQGETLNTKWKKSFNIFETKIFLKCKGSKIGIQGATFQIHLKNSKEIFKINTFRTFSEDKLIEIFNEFKERKSEKIIIDETLIINKIKEKIIKCQ